MDFEQGQLIQQLDDGTEINYYPKTLFSSVYENEKDNALNLKEYLNNFKIEDSGLIKIGKNTDLASVTLIKSSLFVMPENNGISYGRIELDYSIENVEELRLLRIPVSGLDVYEIKNFELIDKKIIQYDLKEYEYSALDMINVYQIKSSSKGLISIGNETKSLGQTPLSFGNFIKNTESIVVGNSSTGKFNSIAIGNNSSSGLNCLSIGNNSKSESISILSLSLPGIAFGDRAKTFGGISIGYGAISTYGSVQLSTGTNEQPQTLKFIDHQISNGTSITASGSDMAEYFEWEDRNIDSQDRRGYFVTIKNNKIQLATSKSDYILGVISSENIASFIGNTAVENWKNKYLKDIYGDYILDENGEKIINPDFKENEKYIPRKDRKEWAVVCLIGQVVVNDDGTCAPGGYCKVNDNGEGTVANNEDNIKYKVLERLDNNHIRILFK